MNLYTTKFLLLLSVFAFVILLFLCYYADGRFPKNPCEMSYMRPSYISNWPKLDTCERYRVLRYIENGNGLDTHDKPKGYPVLFVPGNLGSYKQARTLGSQVGVDIDVYTIDFFSEPVALSGLMLQRQARFIIKVVEAISKLHQGKQVTIVGHSMGAVASWAAQFLEEEGEKMRKLVKTYFSLCAPFSQPIFKGDTVMHQFYSNFTMKEDQLEEDQVVISKNTLLISVSCGRRDPLVPSPYCVTDAIFPYPTQSFQLPASSIGGFSVDHQAILWCKQISMKVAKAVTEVSKMDVELDVTHRREKVIEMLLNKTLTEMEITRLKDSLIQSESTTREKPTWKSVYQSLIFSLRLNWSRLFSFLFAISCLLCADAIFDLNYTQQQPIAAERFVKEYLGVSTSLSSMRIREKSFIWSETRFQSIFNNKNGQSLFQNFAQAFIGCGILGKWYMDGEKKDATTTTATTTGEMNVVFNILLLFASLGCLEVIIFVLSLIKWLVNRNKSRNKSIFIQNKGKYMIPTIFSSCVILGLISFFVFSQQEFDLVLVVAYFFLLVSSLLAALFIFPTLIDWENYQLLIGIGCLHASTVPNLLSAALLGLVSMERKLFGNLGRGDEDEATFRLHPSTCNNKTMFPTLETNMERFLLQQGLFLLLPCFLFYHTYLNYYSMEYNQFSITNSEWGDHTFAPNMSEYEPESKQQQPPTSLVPTQTNIKKKSENTSFVKLVPFKLPNGKVDYLEILTDVEYDGPSILVQVSNEDIVQMDTIKTEEYIQKDGNAQPLRFGADEEIIKRGQPKKWIRPFKCQVETNLISNLGMIQNFCLFNFLAFIFEPELAIRFIFLAGTSLFIAFWWIFAANSNPRQNKRFLIETFQEGRGGGV